MREYVPLGANVLCDLPGRYTVAVVEFPSHSEYELTFYGDSMSDPENMRAAFGYLPYGSPYIALASEMRGDVLHTVMRYEAGMPVLPTIAVVA